MNPYEPPNLPPAETGQFEHETERPHYIGRFLALLVVAYFVVAFAIGAARYVAVLD